MAVEAGLILLGVHLSMRTLAALYRILDLWYTIGSAWPRVVRGILGWGGATLAITLLLPDRMRPSFVWGLLAYLAFYLGFFVFLHAVLRRSQPRRT